MVSDDPRLQAMGDLVEKLANQYRLQGWSVAESVKDVADRIRSNSLTLPVQPRE